MNQSPLANRHLSANAKMADFGGWLMPIEYPDTGAIAEYTAVRERVGLFDVSHLGKISVTGVGALEYLNKMITNDLTKISAGQAQYTLLCNEDGGVVDDLIVYLNINEDLFLIPNAANTTAVCEILTQNAPSGVRVKNLHKDYAVLALQGADSAKVLSRLGVDASLEYMSFVNTKINNLPVILCRTGYTGEFGFEIIPSWPDAEQVWDQIVLVVKEFGGAICGLGARDLLRTEMGYPLHGHELSLSITPVEAGAGWAVGWSKEQFRGKKVLTQQKEQGSKLRLKAILATERGIPRKDMQVKNLQGELIGKVTSGTYSPALKKGIGLALVNSDVKKDDQVLIDIRGTDSTFKVVSLPFVPSKVR
ncbi:MAG: glycine cleavage system aminomethyltransferase GcvT [Candidatus Nanopelagicus sp.]